MIRTRFAPSPTGALHIGGVRTADFKMIDKQGLIYTTARDLDLAIVGDGFFVVSDNISASLAGISRAFTLSEYQYAHGLPQAVRQHHE